ncbi:MAG: hypothetical protein V2A67_09850 [Bacteroidota bacterium]
MKPTNLHIISFLFLSFFITPVHSQNIPGFPLDPYRILKTWTYDNLTKEKGDGEEIIDTLAGQAYLAGIRYSDTWFGRTGNLEFYFTGEKVSRIMFRYYHPARSRTQEQTDLIIRDTAARNSYAREVLQLDSLRRDSIEKEISVILGSSFTAGRSALSDRKAKYSANWINRGYSCVYKDYVEYGDIIFTKMIAPSWISGEFEAPAEMELLQKSRIVTKKISCTTSLLAQPADTGQLAYQNVLLLLEFTNGSRFLEMLPEIPISYLPTFQIDDVDGDGTPDIWISIPVDQPGSVTLQYIYAIPFKEPVLIFSSNDMLPSALRFSEGRQIGVLMPDGKVHQVAVPVSSPASSVFNAAGKPSFNDNMIPAGFSGFTMNLRNRDGSVDFTGRVSLKYDNPELPDYGCLDILYHFATGGWEVQEIRYPCNTAR